VNYFSLKKPSIWMTLAFIPKGFTFFDLGLEDG